MSEQTETLTTTCCIAGGGPAGMMLGYLLARSGVDVMVVEKHKDFFRDFRGDTIHPSTLEILRELDLLDAFLRLPHQEIRHLGVQMAGKLWPMADFSHISTHCKFIGLMPQWDFLNFLAEQASQFPNFKLLMETDVTNVMEQDEQIIGVKTTSPQGEIDIQATLVVGADGRRSTVRQSAGLTVKDIGAPMDVLWFHLSREAHDPDEVLGNIAEGRFFIMIDRKDYWQCGFVIPKGSLESLKAKGLPDFKQSLVSLVPVLESRMLEIKSWDDIKLLSVKVDRLETWYKPGLLCIGDSAHAMSPVGGVGINLAVQDAVAAANILAEPLRKGMLNSNHLQQLQQRREWPTKVIQAGQVFIQNRIVTPVLSGKPIKPPFLFNVFKWFPFLQGIPAQIIGVGVRPEHVDLRAIDMR